MKRDKEVLKELYDFEGFSFREICKEISVIINLKKKCKTGSCPVCNKKRRKVIETRIRKIRDKNIAEEKCFIIKKISPSFKMELFSSLCEDIHF
ncbi:hypothetical protein J4462_00940 [Candidatus Pacearchaeota archaeon]|nr:hypothetical protein [Candidatus Pacearchaeota archaeon]